MGQDTILASIDPEQLTAVTGGGLITRERDPYADNPNSWAAPFAGHAIKQANQDRATIDPGMTITPPNANMDPGIVQGPPLGNIGDSIGSIGSGGLNI